MDSDRKKTLLQIPRGEIYLTADEERETFGRRDVQVNGVLVRLHDNLLPNDDGILFGTMEVCEEDGHLCVEVGRLTDSGKSETRLVEFDREPTVEPYDDAAHRFGPDAKGCSVIVI